MAETRQKQLAPLLREHIQKNIDSKYDYTTATARKMDIQNFMEINKDVLEKDITLNKVRSSHDPILKQLWKKSGNAEVLERQHKGKNKLKFNGDMNRGNIDPKPQKGKNDESPDTKPTPQGLEQPIPQVAIQAYSVEAVSATFSALFLTLKTAFPQMEDLTDDEKKALGEMWQPAFNLYLQNEKLAVIGIPILSTLGLFVPKVLDARKKGKIAKSKEEGLERQREIDLKNENREKQIKEEIKTRGVTEIPEQTKEQTKPKIGESRDSLVLPKKEEE
jgi:hypothetical protein